MGQAQVLVHEFADEASLSASVDVRLLDVVSELGELAKETLNASAYGGEDFSLHDGWCEELGDLVFAVLCLANVTGVDLDEALADALAKYRRRMDSGGTPGS